MAYHAGDTDFHFSVTLFSTKLCSYSGGFFLGIQADFWEKSNYGNVKM
jgi:hypothetical protein